MLPISLICSSSKIRRDGTSLVFIQYCKSEDKKPLFNTGIAIPPVYWHNKRKRVTEKLPEEYGTAEELNDELQRQVRLLEDMIKFAERRQIADPVTFLKQTFKPSFNLSLLEKSVKENSVAKPKENKDFFFQYGIYLKSKESTVAPSTMDVLKNLKLLLQDFENFRNKKITFDQIDIDFYNELMHYFMYEHIHKNKKEVVKGLRRNPTGKNVKQLIIFLKTTRIKKMFPDMELTGWKIIEEEADAIYLTPEEINTISKLDLSQRPNFVKHRDLLIFGCLTGLRFSDFSSMRSEDVRDGMLYKKQTKSKHWVVVPLRDEANYIFNNIFKKNLPTVTNADLNYYVKEIGRLAGLSQLITHSYMKGNKMISETKPKYEFITTHTCRRSFCTNEFLAGTPVELIMKISGHKSLKDFYKYIKIAPEQAGMRIKELWQARGELTDPGKGRPNMLHRA